MLKGTGGSGTGGGGGGLGIRHGAGSGVGVGGVVNCACARFLALLYLLHVFACLSNILNAFAFIGRFTLLIVRSNCELKPLLLWQKVSTSLAAASLALRSPRMVTFPVTLSTSILTL